MIAQLEDLKANTPGRRLFDSLPNSEFHIASNYLSFNLKLPTVIYKIRPPLAESTISTIELSKMPFGTLSALLCGGITFGYAFVLPKKVTMRVRRNFAKFAIREVDYFDAETFLVNADLVVMGNDQGYIAIANSLYWTKA